MKFILGQKLGMSQIFDEKGNRVPVTLIEAGPSQITQIKTKKKDGYQSVQFGFIIKKKRIKKTEKGKEFKFIKEQRTEVEEKGFSSLPFAIARENKEQLKAGDKIDVSIFQKGDMVKISGYCKGKGFQGVVKRWGFSGRGSSHGVKHEHRTPGSIGTSFPERVIKGKKMPGRAGGQRVTVKNLKVIEADAENNLLVVKGAVPGRKGTLLEIRG